MKRGLIIDFNAGPIPPGPAQLVGFAGDTPIYVGAQPYDHADNDAFQRVEPPRRALTHP